MKLKMLLCIVLSVSQVKSYSMFPDIKTSVCLYENQSQYGVHVRNALDQHGIAYVHVGTLDANDTRLHIIFDAFTLSLGQLPKNYVVYQTRDLRSSGLTNEYMNVLSHAVAVWDYSNENIAYYKNRMHNYFYFPVNYEYADPIILPCLLPINMLSAYRDFVNYSNSYDTDISSHLPTLFVYTVLQNPRMLVEAGVRGGESTKPFRRALDFCNTNIIGIDIEPTCGVNYHSMPNAIFLAMSDMDFAKYYSTSKFKGTLLDFVFIDTSHEYAHTLDEIKMFEPLLAQGGILSFHDSNVTPLNNNTNYIRHMRLNGTMGHAIGNTQGVAQALHEYLDNNFDVSKYCNFVCVSDGITWHVIHYPFCNGFTILKKIQKA